MKYWRAINLTPSKLKTLIEWLEWAEHFEMCSVEYKKPEGKVTKFFFQTTEDFVEGYILPEKIQIERGEKIITSLTPSVSKKIIEQGEANKFIVTDLNIVSAQIVVGKIAWYMINTGQDMVRIHSEIRHHPASGISFILYKAEDVKLLKDLLRAGFQVQYHKFDWTSYP